MPSTNTVAEPRKTLIFIHGRGFKPAERDLEALWTQALRAGLERDAPDRVAAFDRAERTLVYYGDEIRRVLESAGRVYDDALDLEDLKASLGSLRALTKTKQFRREHYERLPGKTPLKEFLADVGAPALTLLGLRDRVLNRFVPELTDYWRAEGSTIRAVDHRARSVLEAALERGDDVMLVSHCLGSVIAFNALWAISRQKRDAGDGPRGKVRNWITLGAPLSDDSVRARLDGARLPARERYPDNVVAWFNVAAEDDYVCHDKSAADDFKPMLEQRLISRIEDLRIYNLALRYGQSNPHCAMGYLIHPRMTRLLAEWLG